MRGAIAVGLVCAALAALPPGAGAQQWTASTGLHLDLYTDDGAPKTKGGELFVPLVLAFETERWAFRASGGYLSAWLDPDGGGRAEVDTFIDTTLSLTYGPPLFGGLASFGVDLDLPSGTRRLTPEERLPIQDRDLVLIWNAGAGGNLNLHVNWARPVGPVTLGIGGGYVIRRKYDPTAEIPDDDLDPGDQWTASARGDVQLTDALRLGLQLTHLRFGVDKMGGQEFFRVGPVWDVELSLDYRPDPWWVRIVPKVILNERHDRLDEDGRLAREARTGSGTSYLLALEVGYTFSDAFALRGMANVMHVAENGYPADHPFFDAGRTKVAVGPGVTWTWRQRVSVDFAVKVFSLWDRADAVRPRDTRFTGMHADLLLTYRF